MNLDEIEEVALRDFNLAHDALVLRTMQIAGGEILPGMSTEERAAQYYRRVAELTIQWARALKVPARTFTRFFAPDTLCPSKDPRVLHVQATDRFPAGLLVATRPENDLMRLFHVACKTSNTHARAFEREAIAWKQRQALYPSCVVRILRQHGREPETKTILALWREINVQRKPMSEGLLGRFLEDHRITRAELEWADRHIAAERASQQQARREREQLVSPTLQKDLYSCRVDPPVRRKTPVPTLQPEGVATSMTGFTREEMEALLGDPPANPPPAREVRIFHDLSPDLDLDLDELLGSPPSTWPFHVVPAAAKA